MKRKVLATIVAAGLLAACMPLKVEGNNKQWFDTTYTFNKAIIDLHNEVIVVDVKSWNDYEGEQLQIVAKDGTVYLTSSYNCTLIKSK